MPGDARLINFKTKSLQTGAATLLHTVMWESSNGKLGDLNQIKTREKVSWVGAPPEFGAAAEYLGPGEHFGLGTAPASSGSNTDNHSIIPTGFLYKLPAAGSSAVWKMRQIYQMNIDNTGWVDIPNSNYEITRWFERAGDDLIAYIAKRGVNDGAMFKTVVSVEKFFTGKNA